MKWQWLGLNLQPPTAKSEAQTLITAPPTPGRKLNGEQYVTSSKKHNFFSAYFSLQAFIIHQAIWSFGSCTVIYIYSLLTVAVPRGNPGRYGVLARVQLSIFTLY